MAEGNTTTTTPETGLERLFDRMRSDLMYELRNIQHGEKPVTGQDNKEKINKFMTKHFPTSDGKDQPPEDDEEDHRPETVVMEVQGIIESRPVSSILQSAAFRRQLENVIRGSIGGSAQRSPLNISRNTASSRGTTSGRGATVASNRGATSDGVSRPSVRAPHRNPDRRSPVNRGATLEATPVPRPRTSVVTPSQGATAQLFSELQRSSAAATLRRSPSSDSSSSIDSFSSARSSADIDDDFDESPRMDSVLPPNTSRPTPQAEADDANNRHFSNISLQDIRAAQREELVEEISELLHSRLVSSTLDSQFRARLELHVQERLAATGTNGAEVQNLIQSLPASGIARNDFSDLGIPSGQDLDNLDTISVTNVSTHSVPYTQSHSHMSREIKGLKSQMAEMKNMLKLTFDLQMDIQRAIRQEVAAAMAQVAGAAVGAAAAPVSSKPVSDTHCLICLERHSDCVLYQCGHMCVCYVCGRDLVTRSLGCPVCRAPIKDVIRAYKTNVD